MPSHSIMQLYHDLRICTQVLLSISILALLSVLPYAVFPVTSLPHLHPLSDQIRGQSLDPSQAPLSTRQSCCLIAESIKLAVLASTAHYENGACISYDCNCAVSKASLRLLALTASRFCSAWHSIHSGAQPQPLSISWPHFVRS